jgi:hypothetical protein
MGLLSKGFAPHAKVIGGTFAVQLELSSVRSQDVASNQPSLILQNLANT